MQCQYAHENFSDYVAGDLERALAISLENHLQECRLCSEEVAGLRRLWTNLDALPAAEPPPFFHENLMHRLNVEIDRQQEQKLQRRMLWDWRLLFQPRWLAAAAALLLLTAGGVGYIKTQSAAFGPLNWIIGGNQHTASVVDGEGNLFNGTPQIERIGTGIERAIKIQFQVDPKRAEANGGLIYTAALRSGNTILRELDEQRVPGDGSVSILMIRSDATATDGTISVSLYAPAQRGMPKQRLVTWTEQPAR